MEIRVPLSTLARPCGGIPCGMCDRCLRKVLKNLASYALKTEDPRGILRDLIDRLDLAQHPEPPKAKTGVRQNVTPGA